MTRSLTHDPESDGATRHGVLSTSSAVAPLVLVSAPQAAFEVTTLRDVVDANDGVLSLREAITLANGSRGLDTITFAESIRGGTITLTADLPTITDDLVIDGDPLDRGAGGIVIDGGSGLGGPSGYVGYNAFSVAGAALRFEDLTIKNSYFSAIGATGGAIALERSAVDGSFGYIASGIRGDGSLSIVDSTLDSFIGFDTAYVVRFDGDVNVERSTISNNSGSTFLGGIIATGDVRISDSEFIGNTAATTAGIILVTGSLTVENSSFVGNGTRDGNENVLITINGDFQIVNSTFSGNATDDGRFYGAAEAALIHVRGDSTGSIVNTTLTGSVGDVFGRYGGGVGNGIYVAPTSRVTISNSIIDDSVVGTIRSNGANTFRDTTVDGATATDRLGVTAQQLFATTEAIDGTSIRAGVAADNGGPTPTVALRNASDNPALDAANPRSAPATDQRGVPRDATPDIGAFELDATPPTVAVAVGDDLLAASETAVVTFSVSEPVRGFAAGDVVLAARGSISDLAPGRGNDWTAVFTPAAEVEQAANTIGVRAGSYTDIVGNPGAGGTSPGFAIDTKAPTVAIGLSTAAVADGETATVTFTFSEPVTGFDLGDIDLGGAAGSLSSPAGSGAVRTAVFTPTGNIEQAANTIAVLAGGYTDLVGNPGGGAVSPRFAVDSLAPSVAIAISDTALTRGETATVTFAFSEAIAGFEAADIDLRLAEGAISDLRQRSGNTWTATFTPDDDVEQAASSIALPAGSYTDLAGNSGGGAVSPVFSIDTTPPIPPVTLAPIAVDDSFAIDAAAVGKKGARLPILANDVAQTGKLAAKTVVLLD